MQLPFINLKKQYESIQTDVDARIMAVLNHGQYIMGPEVIELEKKLSAHIGVNYALACSSGTDALVLALMALDIGPGDAVFTTPFTFFASAEAISLCGATPVFVDIDPETYNLEPSNLEPSIKHIRDKTDLTPKAILPVDLFGLSADYDSIRPIAKQYNLSVLEDSAQAFGAPYHDRKTCSLGDIAATSFYPAKPLGCYGDGGAVFTDNKELYESMLSLRVHGQAQSGDKYDNIRIGLNARMDTIQAAILLEKLTIYELEISLRNKVASQYSQYLGEAVKKPYIPIGHGSVWAQYSIQVPNRDKLKNDLASKGIPTAVFYPIPIHLSTAYAHLGHQKGDFPVAEDISNNIISLPMHPYLSTDEIIKISDAVNLSVSEAR